jgi:hypothetical protein
LGSLQSPWGALEVSWMFLGVPWGSLGRPWGSLGASWGSGRSLGSPVGILGHPKHVEKTTYKPYTMLCYMVVWLRLFPLCGRAGARDRKPEAVGAGRAYNCREPGAVPGPLAGCLELQARDSQQEYQSTLTAQTQVGQPVGLRNLWRCTVSSKRQKPYVAAVSPMMGSRLRREGVDSLCAPTAGASEYTQKQGAAILQP